SVHGPLTFLFQCYRPQRHLHSFPTRRSSDLLMRASSTPTRSRSGAANRPTTVASGAETAPTSWARSTSGGGSVASCLNASSPTRDRKSTRLNSSHDQISYAVFCLKKKNKCTC